MTSNEAYQEAQQRIAEAKRTAASVLNLSNLKLTEVPKKLGQLANLKELYLSQNQLTEVPKELGQLANLKSQFNQINSRLFSLIIGMSL
ncbi:hypothetical protein [Acaryochloris marina]|uniref:hypothetical protein n=1 Tax=Acaryochloris marina TaxID=155978 RepID=UPI001BAF131E|nr:hypothetical protein [Acaryochloris marina]